MEEKNFIEKMKRILKEVGKEYEKMPELLKETFDRLIEKRNEKDQYLTYVIPKIILEEDVNGNNFITYINEDGELLQILDGNIEYENLEDGIKVKVSTFLHEFSRVMKAKEIELAQKGKEEAEKYFKKVQSGEMELSEYANYTAKLADQMLAVKTPEEYLDIILNNYGEVLGDQRFYSMNCDIAEAEGGEKGPRGGSKPVRDKKEEFNFERRREGIEKLMPNYELIEINNGECYGYVYDLAENKNSEKGYIIIVESEKYEEAATKVIYLSQEEFEKFKDDNKDKYSSDIQVRAMYLKDILEDIDKLEQTSRVKHKDYGKWLAIIDYYLKGTKEINPEILKLINDEKFKERFPREYLKESRENLMEER